MTSILLYVPNIFAYFRIIFVTIMIYKMPTNPLISFILTLLSGFLDSIDGDLARYLNQTTKCGLLFDLSIDRLTNVAQMFFLTRLYPRHCVLFLFVGFMEVIRDVAYWVVAYYSTLLSIFETFDITNNSNNAYKEIHDYLIINKRAASFYVIRPIHQNFIHFYIYPFIWYSSDLFYWIIYIVGFHVKNLHKYKQSNGYRGILFKNTRSSTETDNSNNNTSLNITSESLSTSDRNDVIDELILPLINESHSTTARTISIGDNSDIISFNQPKSNKQFYKTCLSDIKYILSLFEYVGKLLDDYIESYQWIKCINNRFIKFQTLSHLFGITMLIGAILKFYLSTYEFLVLFYKLILIDTKVADYNH